MSTVVLLQQGAPGNTVTSSFYLSLPLARISVYQLQQCTTGMAVVLCGCSFLISLVTACDPTGFPGSMALCMGGTFCLWDVGTWRTASIGPLSGTRQADISPALNLCPCRKVGVSLPLCLVEVRPESRCLLALSDTLVLSSEHFLAGLEWESLLFFLLGGCS